MLTLIGLFCHVHRALLPYTQASFDCYAHVSGAEGGGGSQARARAGACPPLPFPWQRRSAHRKTLAAVAGGYHVSLFVFSPTIRRHSIRFTPQGYWLQRGGLFGASKRDQRVIRFWNFSSRLQAEVENVTNFRQIPQI